MTNMSFGQAPQEPNATGADDGERQYRFIDGKLVDSKTGEPVELLEEQNRAVELELDKIAAKERWDRAQSAANRILLIQFPHLSDVPMSARASVSRQELVHALSAAAESALRAAGL